jgi:4-amino-4-deoxy-L-arabinose transferase-like glycosyltransferase
MKSRTARLYEYGGALLVLLVRIFTAPRTPWENDEFLFTEAVRNFDPSRYHPHPPGYPLFILLGKLLHFFVHDPWRALVVVNIIAAPIGFIALARALRNWIGPIGIDDGQIAVAASLIYFLSASMMIHGPLALSDPVAMTFVALALAVISAGENGEGRAEERRARSGFSALPSPLSALRSPPDSEHERAAILAGLWTSCAIGCRPQLVVPLAPLLAIAL